VRYHRDYAMSCTLLPRNPITLLVRRSMTHWLLYLHRYLPVKFFIILAETNRGTLRPYKKVKLSPAFTSSGLCRYTPPFIFVHCLFYDTGSIPPNGKTITCKKDQFMTWDTILAFAWRGYAKSWNIFGAGKPNVLVQIWTELLPNTSLLPIH
jgi:hypothetical protein